MICRRVGSVSALLDVIGLKLLQELSAISCIAVAQPVSRHALNSPASSVSFARIGLASSFYGSFFDLPSLVDARPIPRKERDQATDDDSDVQPVAGENRSEKHHPGLPSCAALTRLLTINATHPASSPKLMALPSSLTSPNIARIGAKSDHFVAVSSRV